MKSRLITNDTGRTFVLLLEDGEEVYKGILEFANEYNLRAARFTAIGALSKAIIGFYDLDTKDYVQIKIDEQLDVLLLSGNIALSEGKPTVHAHVILGERSGEATGGHLLEAYARPILEVIITESPENMQREIDQATGLPLLRMS